MKSKHIIYLHIAVWSLMLISNIWFAYSRNLSAPDHAAGALSSIKILIIQTGYLAIPVFCFYCAYYFVAPRLFVARKYFKAVLIFLLTVAGAVVLRYSLEYFSFCLYWDSIITEGTHGRFLTLPRTYSGIIFLNTLYTD